MSEEIRGATFGDIAIQYQGYQFTIDQLGVTGTVNLYLNETDTSPEARNLGLPRDLDGDGTASDTYVSGNYILCPIRMSVTIDSNQGPQTIEHYFLLSQEE